MKILELSLADFYILQGNNAFDVEGYEDIDNLEEIDMEKATEDLLMYIYKRDGMKGVNTVAASYLMLENIPKKIVEDIEKIIDTYKSEESALEKKKMLLHNILQKLL